MAILLLALLVPLMLVSRSDAYRTDIDIYDEIGRLNSSIESKVGDLQSAIKDLTAKNELCCRKIYFKATFKELLITSQSKQTVVFDKLLEKIGNAYQPTTGIFTAPVPGLYIFAVQTFTQESGDANWDLRVNGQRVLRTRSKTVSDTSNEFMFPLILKPGDQVSVYNDYNTFKGYGTDHSFFAGWILMPL